ncbi:MAG TPA: hypothetical protein VD772_12385 [Anseongella sp.]|nr:hypothetical protein [Anseongella sp.]
MMKTLLKIASFSGLMLAFLPSLLVLGGQLDMESHYRWTLAGTIVWFATAPFWIDKKKKISG